MIEIIWSVFMFATVYAHIIIFLRMNNQHERIADCEERIDKIESLK